VGERAFVILCLLAGNGESGEAAAADPLTALTVEDIVTKFGEPLLDSSSTVYKNLVALMGLGYVKKGICKGRAHTYYVTKKGMDYISSF